MKINKINVYYSRTVQMRQFEPAVFSVTIEAQVDPTDKAETVIARAKKTAKESVEVERQALLDERIASRDDEKEKSA